jgi:hypothetical protein
VRLASKLEYTHLELNRDFFSIAGYYTPLKEIRLKYDSREVLYVVGRAVIESSCCGTGSYGYVLVPGYIINWQNEKSEKGLPVSEVEPVSDEVSKDSIRGIIEEAEHISRIEFW